MVKNYKEVFSSSGKQYFETPQTWGGYMAAFGSGIHILILKLGGGTFSMYLYKIKGSLSNMLVSVGLEIRWLNWKKSLEKNIKILIMNAILFINFIS